MASRYLLQIGFQYNRDTANEIAYSFTSSIHFQNTMDDASFDLLAENKPIDPTLIALD